ncbi:MAG TPA: desaturase, partial [Piscinibacter sp.]|nr:desaturase [Piscinibacter sp.]
RQFIAEKRATFRCVPALARPPVAIAPALVAAGDHIDGPYPATIEGAVRSAVAAVASLR